MKFDMKGTECAAITSIVLGTASVLLALIGNFWCQYAYTPVTFTSTINPSNTSTYNIYHGLWNYKYFSTIYYTDGSDLYSTTYASCSGYSGQYLTADTKWNTAKAFSIIAVCIGGIAMFASCAAFGRPRMWMIISLMLLVTTLSQGLTFLFFPSSGCAISPQIDTKGTSSSVVTVTFGDKCALASGAKLAISATVLWFVSALAAAMAGKKVAPEERDEVADVKQQEDAVAQPEEAVEEGK